jgi:hypothetical protein
MWQTHAPCDPEYHARNQQRHGSWVMQLNPKQAHLNRLKNVLK